MEKKTIGGFIAALRKANGMTQKDLAERLNVSDKTVSRWERDDGAPDLAVIPVIAEIFDVTCDELLRGERKSPTERAEATEESEPTPKAEKQRQRLLKSTLGQFTRNYTQTVKRAADNKRRYAPGWVHSTCLLRGFPKGAAPHLAHDFAEQSVVCYTLCRRCPENTVAAGEGKGI